MTDTQIRDLVKYQVAEFECGENEAFENVADEIGMTVFEVTDAYIRAGS